MRNIDGAVSDTGGRYAIVASRFNDLITDRLISGAEDALMRCGVKSEAIDCVRVPGAYEIPLAIQALARKGGYRAVVALGCVIRGATPHFDYVAGECAKGIARVSLDQHLPVGFGVLTVDTIEQALERAGSKAGNKGADAAMAALEMAGVLDAIDQDETAS